MESGNNDMNDEPAGLQRVVDLNLNEDMNSDQVLEDEEEEESVPTQQSQVRRSSQIRKPVEYYIREKANLTIHQEPTSHKDAVNSPEKDQWNQAMDNEMESLKANDVWELTTLPPGKQVVGSKWVYKRKTGEDGGIRRYKARLVAQGFNQQWGLDYDETFSPVVRMKSF